MDFSFALKQVKKGKKINREGWNGKDQYVTLGKNFSFLDASTDTLVNPNHDSIGNCALIFSWNIRNSRRLGSIPSRYVSK